METWAPIPGFSKYEASSEGRIRSNNTRRGWTEGHRPTGRLLALFTRPDGYQQVKMTDDEGRGRTMKVHRAVLLAFLGEPPEGYTASHMNNDPGLNTVENLSWEPLTMNVMRQKPNGTALKRVRGDGHHQAKLTAENVSEARRLHAEGSMGFVLLARRYKVSKPAIRNAVQRRTWRHIA